MILSYHVILDFLFKIEDQLKDDHFCPDCLIGRSIMMENPALSELASRWQFDGDEYQIRFDLLAKYLVENGNSFDSHFKSQYESCRLCTIKYDYIIKLETLHEGKIQSYLRGMQPVLNFHFGYIDVGDGCCSIHP